MALKLHMLVRYGPFKPGPLFSPKVATHSSSSAEFEGFCSVGSKKGSFLGSLSSFFDAPTGLASHGLACAQVGSRNGCVFLRAPPPFFGGFKGSQEETSVV